MAFAEWTDIDNAIGLYAHPVQRGSVSDWRDDQPTIVLEADESSGGGLLPTTLTALKAAMREGVRREA